ncbi:His Kinase A (phospho-acceptor) domain-containing protein [Polaribacter sp. KT25b]|uniref:sensor histidine kinase n=1 Tax=Polaribacter sp. KT25b TaxID=1855336 RepID=UPI0008799D5D|nr:ATP-binding protein [Polaribacter sp. KT25b]SDR90375.1 His Kinase A (phospho-acceptor) domain-containing protein [Polaribacter sp. KT25b]
MEKKELLKENKILKAKLAFIEEKLRNIENENEKQIDIKNAEFDDFVYIISHDLNEPIRTINSFVEIIKEEYHDSNDKKLGTYFYFIEDAIKRLNTKMKSLLDFSRLGKNQTLELTDINETIDSIKIELSDLIKKNNASIVYSDLPIVNCYSSEIKQVLLNLILNSIKFKQPKNSLLIEISCISKPSFWEFCVKDNGIGINDNEHFEIFQMFNKLDITNSEKSNGTGLAFCKKIIEIHKGTIWVKSTLDLGVEFHFTISK